jgi:hypothetical protein
MSSISAPGKDITGGPVIYFEILVDALVESTRDQANTPEIAPEFTVPLP